MELRAMRGMKAYYSLQHAFPLAYENMNQGHLLEEGNPISWLYTSCEINVSSHNVNASCHKAYRLRQNLHYKPATSAGVTLVFNYILSCVREGKVRLST